jgi:hypothetical protein
MSGEDTAKVYGIPLDKIKSKQGLSKEEIERRIKAALK